MFWQIAIYLQVFSSKKKKNWKLRMKNFINLVKWETSEKKNFFPQ